MNKKVFLAESSSLIAKKISSVLQACGFEIEIFEDGLDCASAALKSPPFCLLCDFSLKTITGLQLCSVVKNSPDYCYFPIILFTIEDFSEDFWVSRCGADKIIYMEDNDFTELVQAVKNCRAGTAGTAGDSETAVIDAEVFVGQKALEKNFPMAVVHSMERIRHYAWLLDSAVDLAAFYRERDTLIKEIFSVIHSLCRYDGAALFLNQDPVECFFSGTGELKAGQDGEQKEGGEENSFFKICMNDFRKLTAKFGTGVQKIKSFPLESVLETGGKSSGSGFDADKLSSYMVFPLESSGITGTLHIASKVNNFFDYKTVATLEFFCQKIGFILESAVQYRKSIAAEKGLRSALSKYVPEEIIGELLKTEKNETQSENEKRRVAILICDIRNFTSLSEINKPENVVGFLNGYFSRMVDVIKKHGGSIDKFMGDAIMAIFGAPISYVDNADRSLKAALEMISTLPEIDCSVLDFPEGMTFDIGIGIHYGEVIVGNIGCKDKRDYTVIGDTVNLASRLEGLTKKYGAKIILSEGLKKELKGNFNLLQVDTVKVKGKKLGVQIYKAAGRSFGEEFMQCYQKGLSLYTNGAFSLALSYFDRALELVPEDKSCLLLKERCVEFCKNPPENWDGAVSLTSK